MSEKHNVFSFNIEKYTIKNNYYRKVIFTSEHQQLVLMSLKPREYLPFEIHPNNDQFFRFEQGTGILLSGKNKEFISKLSNGVSATVPQGTWHQVINTSKTKCLKFYTIYSPPHHHPDRIDFNKPQNEI